MNPFKVSTKTRTRSFVPSQMFMEHRSELGPALGAEAPGQQERKARAVGVTAAVSLAAEPCSGHRAESCRWESRASWAAPGRSGVVVTPVPFPRAWYGHSAK